MQQSYTAQHKQLAQQQAGSRQVNGPPQCLASPAGKTDIYTQYCSQTLYNIQLPIHNNQRNLLFIYLRMHDILQSFICQ